MIEIPAECLTSQPDDSPRVRDCCEQLARLTPDDLRYTAQLDWPVRIAVAAIESHRVIRPLLHEDMEGDVWLRAMHAPDMLAIEAAARLREVYWALRREQSRALVPADTAFRG